MEPERKKQLEALVVRHKVVFESRPALNYTQGDARKIGYDVTLYGTHSHPAHEPDAGCDECVKVWHDLEKISRFVIPEDQRDTRIRILPFDQLLRESKARKFRYDVALVLELRHRREFLNPLDECETHCRDELLVSLRSLGVQEHTWDDSKARRHAGTTKSE